MFFWLFVPITTSMFCAFFAQMPIFVTISPYKLPILMKFTINQPFSTLRPYSPFFGLRRTQLDGIITSPCSEVTLDTFGFPLRARSAARRAVFWYRWPPKWPFLSQKGYAVAILTSQLQQDQVCHEQHTLYNM